MNSKRINILYGLLHFFYWSSACAIYGFAAVFLADRSFDTGRIGLLLSAASILAFLIQPVLAGFADKGEKGALHKATLLLLIIGEMALIMLFIQKRGGFLTGLLYMLALVTNWAEQPLVNSFSLYYGNHGIPVTFGRARGVGSVAYSAAAAILGFLTGRRWISAIPMSGIISVGVCIIIICLMPTADAVKENTVIKSSHQPTARGASFFKKYRRFTVVLIGVLLLYIVHNMIANYMIYILERVGGDSGDLGICNSLAAVLELLPMFTFHLLVKKIGSGSLLKIAAVFYFIRSAAYLLADSVTWFYALQLLQVGSFAIIIPGTVQYAGEKIADEDKYKGQAYMTGMNTLGCVIGSFCGGQVIKYSDTRYLLIICLILPVLGYLFISSGVRENSSITGGK